MGFIKKLFSIMNKKQKTALVILFVAILVNAGLELIGVALISPVVTVLQAEGQGPNALIHAVNSNLFSKLICNVFHIAVVPGNQSLIIVTMLVTIIVLYVFKACVFILVSYLVSLYTYSLSRSLSSKMIKAYLSMPYDYFINTNSSIIIRKCTSDVTSFTNCINGVTNVLVAIFTSLGIFIYLMLKQWAVTLVVVGVMGISTYISVFAIKRKIRKRGRLAQQYNSRNIDILHRTIYGIKETKIARSEDFFTDQYYKNAYANNKNMIVYDTLNKIPSVIVQNFGIIILMIVLIVLVNFHLMVASEIVTLLTALVVAIVKLLPNINIISNQAVQFSFFGPCVECITEDIAEANRINELKRNREAKSDGKKITFNKDININGLSFKYKDGFENVINNANILINKGEYVAISGQSGAGKTTLVDNILGLLEPQEGDILIDNKSIYDNIDSWHALLSYVPQSIYLLDDTVKANVCFGLDLKEVNDEDVWKSLDKAQLKELIMSLPNKLDTKIGEAGVKLSGGQRQRIGIARAFFRNTPIIVLDEATSALDYQTEEAILNDIRKIKGDKTIIIITHRLNTISSCDKIYSIENRVVKQIK